MSGRQAPVNEYLEFLKELENQRQFLIGGQAVNFWAEIICREFKGTGIRKHEPFTSEDCDIWADYPTWEQFKEKYADKITRGSSPLDGQLGILELSKAPLRVVDVMQGVYGIRTKDCDRLYQRAPNFSGVRVMDPIYLFLSKCHCLVGLDQSPRQDEKHLRILTEVLPYYFTLLIQEAEEADDHDDEVEEQDKVISPRDVTRDIKLLIGFLKVKECRQALGSTDVDPDDLIPWERMKRSSVELFRKFAASQEPGS